MPLGKKNDSEMLTLDVPHDQCLAPALPDQLNCSYLFRCCAFWMDVCHHHQIKIICILVRHWYGWGGLGGGGALVGMKHVARNQCGHIFWHFLALLKKAGKYGLEFIFRCINGRFSWKMSIFRLASRWSTCEQYAHLQVRINLVV